MKPTSPAYLVVVVALLWILCSVQAIASDEIVVDAVLAHPAADGALILETVPNSQAQQVGLKPGDIIVAYAGQPVTDHQTLVTLIGATATGPIPVVVQRADAKVTVQVQPGKIGVLLQGVRKGVAGVRPAGGDQQVISQSTTRSTDRRGRLVKLQTPAGTVDYAWDRANRLLKRGHMGYGYDGLGLMDSVQSNGQPRMTLSYNPQGQLSGIELPHQVARSMAYDAAGRLSSVAISVANGSNAIWQLTRERDGSIASMTDIGGSVRYARLFWRLGAEIRTGQQPTIITYGYNNEGDLVRQVTYAPTTSQSESFAGPNLPATVTPVQGDWAVEAGQLTCREGRGMATWNLGGSNVLICPAFACTVVGAGRPGLTVGDANMDGQRVAVRLAMQQVGAEAQGRVELNILGASDAPDISPWLPLPTPGRIEICVDAVGNLGARLTRPDGTGGAVATAIKSRLTGVLSVRLESGSAAAWFDDLAWSTATSMTTATRTVNPKGFLIGDVTETVTADGRPPRKTSTTFVYDGADAQTSAMTTPPDGPAQTTTSVYDMEKRLSSLSAPRGKAVFRWASGSGILLDETQTVNGAMSTIPVLADDMGILAYGGTTYGSVGAVTWWSETAGVVTTCAVDALGNVAGLIGDLGVLDVRLRGQIGWLEQRTYTAYGVPTVYRAMIADDQERVSLPTVIMRPAAPWISGPGFRGGWTDPLSGRVRFGVRWYQPAYGAWTRMNYTDWHHARFTWGSGDPFSADTSR